MITRRNPKHSKYLALFLNKSVSLDFKDQHYKGILLHVDDVPGMAVVQNSIYYLKTDKGYLPLQKSYIKHIQATTPKK